MHPVLFYVGDIPIFSYSVFMLLGIVTLFGIVFILGHRDGRSWEDMWPVAVAVFAGAIVGSRLTQLLVEPARTSEFIDFYAFLRPNTPGNIVGMMLGGIAMGLAVRRALKLPSTANFYAPASAAATVLWRIGCTLGGCCHGIETTVPWAIEIDGIARHPTMIYEGFFNLAMLVLMMLTWRRWQRDDELLGFYVVGYAFFRFWLEFIRLYPPIWGGLTGIQLLCLFILLSALIYLVFNYVRGRLPEPGPAIGGVK